MKKTEANLIGKIRELRTKGYSLGEISNVTCLAKTTLYGYVRDIRLNIKQKKDLQARNKEKYKNRINPRKGKCLPGREIITPKPWFEDLVHIVAHFMFDGRVDEDGCIYYSKCKYQVNHMKKLLHKVFKIKPRVQLRDKGVYGIVIYNVEFADYIKKCESELPVYINNGAPKSEKTIFLKAFFDDEGSVFYKGDKRRVRGSQKSALILKLIKDLLSNFNINSKINKNFTDLEISGQRNLKKFSEEINFSPQIYINPDRKNGIWKRAISKRTILDSLLNSYQAG